MGGRAAIAGAALAVLLAACGGGDDGDDTESAPAGAESAPAGAESASEAGDGGDSLVPESPEPADPCTLVDPQIVADAAGLTIDVTDQDATGDIDLGSFATKSCSYANGQMVISTVTYPGDAEAVQSSFVDNAESNGGTVLTDLDLGSLPASTLVTEVNGLLAVNVLEAPTPFGVGFTQLDDPAAAVAAAEAVLTATG